MKKIAFVLFVSMLFVLGACSSNDVDDQSSNNADNNTSTEGNQDETSGETTTDDEEAPDNGGETEDQVDDNAGDSEAASDNELADFPEYETLVDEIDVDTLEAKIETDNPNKRVILYADDSGEKQYKSIFIKKKDRLKIIHFDDDGQIFNEVIK